MTTNSVVPVFAVVGHPNKGKSSIVATLAQDDSIAISNQSGTTRVAEPIDVKVGASQYTLVDTPGFQRPGKVLRWLQQQADSADKRQAAVAQFIDDAQCQEQFPDEVELLTPIMKGAAILYVVDGSRPYGSEYEAEMEILRWTGQASMALINPIENEDYIEQWQQALGQYFKVVRVFNAMAADVEKQRSVLEAFSIIKQDWQGAIEQLIIEYQTARENQQQQSVHLLATLLTRLCGFQLSQKTLTKSQAQLLQPTLQAQYIAEMNRIEKEAHDRLKQLFRYHHLDSDLYGLPLDDGLFDTEKWIVWGLNRKQLTAAAAMAGAATGAGIDLALAGSSLMLGALGGSLIAGGSAWFAADRIAEFKIKGLPVGGFEARQGPINNRNFPYVVLGRFLFLEQALRSRTHARRDDIVVKEGELTEKIALLETSAQRELHKALDRLRRQKPVDDLAKLLRPLLN